MAATILLAACFKVPYTNRKALNAVPEDVMISLGKSSYRQTLQGEKVLRATEDAELLTDVGERIARVADKPEYQWEYTLVEDDEINAWCIPGGKIAFYTGILPVLRHEAGMSFVMGHEVAHAVARHGGERLSQQLALFGGLAGLYAVLSSETELTQTQRLAVVGALGIGVEVGAILPFSRMHESEADIIGTMYMAEAGYPPDEAITVWDRMTRQTGGSPIPVFLSTHPSDEKRQAVIREWLPRANKKYARNKLAHDTVAKRWGVER